MPASQTTASGDRGAPRARRGSSRGRGRGGRATSNPFSGPVTRGRGTTSQRFDTPSTTQNQVHNAPRSRGRGRGRVAPAAAPSTFSSPFQQAASTSSAQTLEHEIIRDLDMAAVKTRRDQVSSRQSSLGADRATRDCRVSDFTLRSIATKDDGGGSKALH